jgi:non-ribosomal peptide synthetase component F
VLERQLGYWRERLAGVSALDLASDRARPSVQSHRGETHAFELSAALTGGLRRLARERNATLYMTLLAAFEALLQRYTGQGDFAIGTPIANRTEREVEELIGFFVNTLVVRADVSADPSFSELLGRVHNYVLAIAPKLDLALGARYALVSTFAADLGNTVIFPSLCGGGCLHLPPAELTTDPAGLGEYFARHEIDCLKIVPSHLAALLSAGEAPYPLPRQRLVLGGEAASAALIAEVAARAPACRVLNHYGPTETTVDRSSGWPKIGGAGSRSSKRRR